MASVISAGTTSGTAIAISGDTTGNLAFQTNGTTTAMTIDTSQNVGIGSSSPSYRLDVLNNASTVAVRVKNSNTTSKNGIQFDNYVSTASGSVYYDNANAAFTVGGDTGVPTVFNSAGSERMRINSNGNLLIGTTTEAGNETPLVLSKNSGTTRWSVGPFSSVPTNFYITGTSAAQGVYLNGTSATSWSGLSDERYKTDLKNIENAIDKVFTLRAVTGKFIEDEEQKSRSFLIAQDVQKVLPEAVDDSNPDRLGLAYTDIIPLLVAAIKELNAKVEAQAVRIAELEGAK